MKPVILVAEDNVDDVFFLRRAFRAADDSVDVRIVGDGKGVLRYLRHEGEFADASAHPFPALVFLDLKMPFLSGLEALALIRADAALKHLRVYVLTSSSEDRDRERAVALGAEGYLVKPPTPSMLQPILATLNPPASG